jgi:hypothetical protein
VACAAYHRILCPARYAMKAHDLRGRQFGDRTVIGRAPNKYSLSYWYVRCKCGDVSAAATKFLLNGSADRCLSCAGLVTTQRRIAEINAMAGTRFGSRTIVGNAYQYAGGKIKQIMVEVACDCGTRSFIAFRLIKSGRHNKCLCCGQRERYAKASARHSDDRKCAKTTARG